MASGWTMRAVVARLLACELRSRRGRANGYAALDATGRIPGGQLPGSTVLALWRNTTDSTPTELFFDGASSRFTLADNAAYRIQVRILACRSDVGAAANTAIWRFEGIAYRGSGAGSVSWDQSFGDPVTHATGWSATVSADTVNGSLKFAVTGAAAQAVSWYAVVDYLALPSNQAFTGPGSAVTLGPPVLPLLAVTLQNTAARTGRTPPAGELIRDTTTGVLYVGDGTTVGGAIGAVLPAGSGSEIQYRSGANTFGAVANVARTSNGNIALTQQVNPAGPSDGELWYGTQKILSGRVNGIDHRFVGCLYSQVADGTVSNTAAESSIVNTAGAVGTLVLPANFFGVGKTLWIVAGGIYGTAAAGPLQRFRIKFGSVTVADGLQISLNASQTTKAWMILTMVTCRSVGATGSFSSVASTQRHSSSGTSVVWDTQVAATVDTTGPITIDLSSTFGTADPANTITCSVLTVDVKN